MNDEDFARLAGIALGRLPAGTPLLDADAPPHQNAARLNALGENLRAAGEWETAERFYQAAAARPDTGHWAIDGLARVAMQRGDWRAAAAAWAEALVRFPAHAKLVWYDRLADCLTKSGAPAEAARVREAMAEKFPDALASLMFRARAAERADDWDMAAAIWRRCEALHGDRPRLVIWLGRAQSLLRCGLVEQAVALYQAARAEFPLESEPLVRTMVVSRELGLLPLAQECAATLIEKFPAQIKPAWYAELYRTLVGQRREDEARAVLATMEARFPGCEALALLAVENANRVFYGLQEMLRITRAGAAAFPGNRLIRAEYVRALLANGECDAAAECCAGLAAEAADQHTLVSQCRLILDGGSEAALRDFVTPAAQGGRLNMREGLALGSFLLGLLRPWAAELALDLFAGLARHTGFRPVIAVHHIKALLALRRDTEALVLVDALPPVCAVPGIQELRGWAAAQRGELQQAKAIWHEMLAGTYHANIHAPLPNLELLHLPPGLEDGSGVSAVVVIRNEAALLPDFLQHHRRLGVRRFIVIDNGSCDGSAAYLAAQPDVILYRTEDSFRLAGSGMRWKEFLIERHAMGIWCLNLDADEAFIYPGYEQVSLDAFTAYLDAAGAEAVTGYMLDVYPAVLAPAGVAAPRAAYIHYDPNETWMGLPRPPYLQPVGGVRSRLFGVQETLHKVPLFKAGSGRTISSHETTPMRFAGVTSALLHYKLLGLANAACDAAQELAGSNDRGTDTMRRYRRYEARLAALLTQDLREPAVTQTLGASLTLAARGVFAAPPAYMLWLQGLGLGKQALLF